MKYLAILVAMFLFSYDAFAQDADSQDQDPTPNATFQRYPDAPSVTRHSVEINGQTIHYQATADTITLVDDDGEPTASLFYMAYRKIDGGADSAKFPTPRNAPSPSASTAARALPVCGCTWASSVHGVSRTPTTWANPGPPPYGVIPNAHSLLDKSDFVFIDPVSTGYSRAKGRPARSSSTVRERLDSVADFIRMYLTREQRWGQPQDHRRRELRHHPGGGPRPSGCTVATASRPRASSS